MARRRYPLQESVQRILKLFRDGGTIPEEPGLDEQLLSTNESASDFAELVNDSLPNETFTLPTAVQNAVQSVTGTAIVHVQDEGVPLPFQNTLDFVGDGVIVTNGSGKTQVLVTGTASAGTVTTVSDSATGTVGTNITQIDVENGLDVSVTGTIAYVGYRDIGARVYNDADITISNNTVTKIAFNQERWDTNNMHDNVTNNTRLTCNIAGKYNIYAQIMWDTSAVGSRQLRLLLNNTTRISQVALPSVAAGTFVHAIGTTYNLNVGDYIEIQGFQNSGGDLDIKTFSAWTPEFMMQKIG